MNEDKSRVSVVETSRSPLHLVFNEVGPNESNDSRVVIAVRQIMVQRRKTMPLAGRFHLAQLLGFEFVLIDVSPIER